MFKIYFFIYGNIKYNSSNVSYIKYNSSNVGYIKFNVYINIIVLIYVRGNGWGVII